MTKVAVVILNWNGRDFLKKFLPKVIEYSNNEYTEIVVADNDSKDDSVTFLKKYFPEIRIIVNATNGGFAKGYNDALKQIDAEYYVLLNSDVEVTKNWIEPVIEMMDADKNIAAAQPKLLSYDAPEYFEYAGAAGGYIDILGYPFCRGRIFQSLEKDTHQYNNQQEIFWASGACMFVRAELYHNHGGLDEDFFAHMEEIDFCWRLKNHGYKIMFTPKSTIYHVGGGTLPKISSFKAYLNIRNNNMMLLKNLPSNIVLPILFLRLVMDGIAALKFAIDGSIKDLLAVAKAHFDFYRMIPKTIKKRKEIKPKKVSLVYYGNIVFEHFIKGKTSFKQLDTKRFSRN